MREGHWYVGFGVVINHTMLNQYS